MEDIMVTLPMRKYESLLRFEEEAKAFRVAIRACVDLQEADVGRVRFDAGKFAETVRGVLPPRYAECNIDIMA